MRIGDRNLINSVHSDDFLGQLGCLQRQADLVATRARASGPARWTSKSELNQDVITAFPVLEAVGSLKPGVYVMFAKPSGGPVARPPATMATMMTARPGRRSGSSSPISA